jgi:iron complex outermembrane receptor protein
MRANSISVIDFGAPAKNLTAAIAVAMCFLSGTVHAQDESVLEEITVTAQRRSEPLQQVPISVTAIDASTVERMGVGGTLDIGVAVPAVTVSPQPSGAAFTIRGVSGTGSGGDESPNAVYLDGVYLKSVSSLVFSFKDIERIEVLKGPQGTLFGRNATGGVIQIVTKSPTQEPHAEVTVGYGNYDTTQVSGYGSIGLTSTLSASVSTFYEHQGEGWGRNITLNKDVYRGQSEGARAKLLWQPSDATSVLFSALYSDVRPNVLDGTRIVPGMRDSAGPNNNLGFYDTSTNVDQRAWFYQKNFALTVHQSLGWANFTSITAYDDTTLNSVVDTDSSAAAGPGAFQAFLYGPDKTWTQEFQLLSPQDSKVQWIGGLYYLNNRQLLDPLLVTLGPAIIQSQYSRVDTKSYAAFAQATYPILESTNLTTGVRYTRDNKVLNAELIVPPAGPFPAGTTQDGKPTWRVALDHRFTDRMMGYISQSRGFKSGIYNGTSPTQPPSRPSTLDASEIGLKTELFDRRLRLNSAVYYYRYDDMQVRLLNPNGIGTRYVNAAKAEMKGVDVDFEALLGESFRLLGSVSYLNGKYTKFPGAETYVPGPAPGPVLVSCSPYPTTPAAQAICAANGIASIADTDAAGNRTIQSPEWVGTLTGQYVLKTSMGEITPAVTYSYNSGFYWNPQNRTRSDAYSLVNATLTWTSPAQSWNVQLWGKNLTNTEYFSSAATSSVGDNYYPGAPRTYGASLGWRY